MAGSLGRKSIRAGGPRHGRSMVPYRTPRVRGHARQGELRKEKTMFGILPITPAYGRDPKSHKAAQADLDDSKDWRCSSGQYIGKSDLVDILGAGKKIEARSADRDP